jgi:hypothetical protein
MLGRRDRGSILAVRGDGGVWRVALGQGVDREGLSPWARVRKVDGQEDFQQGGNVRIDDASAGKPAAHGVSMFAVPAHVRTGPA